jgi:hypothetical protein
MSKMTSIRKTSVLAKPIIYIPLGLLFIFVFPTWLLVTLMPYGKTLLIACLLAYYILLMGLILFLIHEVKRMSQDNIKPNKLKACEKSSNIQPVKDNILNYIIIPVLVLGLISPAFILAYQLYSYTNTGIWLSLSIIEVMVTWGNYWAISPHTWFGFHETLNYINISVPIALLAFLLLNLVNDD